MDASTHGTGTATRTQAALPVFSGVMATQHSKN